MESFCFIGDVHGLADWKEIVAEALSKQQNIIFVGDYLDSFHVKAAYQMYNLKEIITLKKKYPDRITLLLGNHDWSYIYNEINISGFQHKYWYEYKGIFDNDLDLFDVAWGYRNWKTQKYTLVTHAGLTFKYWKDHISSKFNDKYDSYYNKIDINDDLHQILNKFKGDRVLWKVGSMRGGTGTPGPLWADYLELLEDPYPEINQVFGHTAAGTVSAYQNGDDLLIKVDGYGDKKMGHMTVTL